MPKKLYNVPSELDAEMKKYINTCKIKNQIKMRDSEGDDYLADISDLNGTASVIWIKAPSVNGFCNYANISRQSYYANYRKKPGFDEVCQDFESICDEADMDCQYNKNAQVGAKWRLQLRGYETSAEKIERQLLLDARRQREEEHKKKMEAIEIKNRLLSIQVEKAKNDGEVDPLINQLISDIGWDK